MLEQGHNFYTRIQNSGNFLLVKDDVGKGKPTVRRLPPPEFYYGMGNKGDMENAGDLINSWKEHTMSAS